MNRKALFFLLPLILLSGVFSLGTALSYVGQEHGILWADFWRDHSFIIVAAGGGTLAAVAVLLGVLFRVNRRLYQSRDSLRLMGERLREDHRRLDSIIRGTRAGTWEWNVQTGEARFNERWAEIIGYTLDELRPISIETWTQLAHPEDMAASEAALEQHFSGEMPYYDFEARMRHKDGHWVWVHDRGAVVEWTDDGKPLWMYGTHTDITRRREALMAVTELLERMEQFSHHVPGMIYQYRLRADGTSHIPYASDGIIDIYGCTPDAVAEDVSAVFAVLHPDDIERVSKSIRTSAETLTRLHDTYRVNHPVKGLRWVEGIATPSRAEDGSITWHGYASDVTDLHHARERLQLAATVFEASQEAIIILDAEFRIVEVNLAFTLAAQYDRTTVMGQMADSTGIFASTKKQFADIKAILRRDGHWQGERWTTRKSGDVFAERLSISASRNEKGDVTHYVAVLSDISRIMERQQELDRIANYDPLTGIVNRRLLSSRLAQAIAHARRSGTRMAVCVIDLDGFKDVNDRHGHETGDKLLIALAARLSSVMRAEETVARLGGDEFALVFSDLDSTVPFDRVLEVARQPVDLDGIRVQLTASMGVSWYRSDIADGDQLLREADTALYDSKRNGRDRFTVFQQPNSLIAC
ncbi:MAG: diguanylate cyclase [Oceanibaculum nanhaiense]|uniref:sensor domain-containing protein n=1 Tax=Oceanibaculum nanhaiense TaxID=1909734 RepID=UPI0025A3E8C5|nr:sensor domain-containing diguanylate cyclase [Oceanibaculum nanhaiense]MDM7945260.1 diguanylate cyclase [Oceanibaculum nanhaiense]